MHKIKTFNAIAQRGLDELDQERFEVGPDADTPDAILVRSADLHKEPLPDSLQAIARAGAGYNNIPVDSCSKAGVVVFNTPGANANSVKELVIASLLLAARDIQGGVGWARQNAANPELAKMVEKEKKRFAGSEIMGKSLGVVGLGAIGVMVANAATALGMRVIGFDPFISVDAAWGVSRSVERARSLDHLLESSDYVTIHVPLNENTRDMIGEKELRVMKKGARLLNFSRGGLVDERALIAALDAESLATYVTDFPSAAVAGHRRVIPVPHLGASTAEAEENCAVMAARQIREFLLHGNIVNSVNFPECTLAPSDRQRILVANRNIPNMVGQITTILANQSINILNLLNRHRDELAYNIIDIDGNLTADALNQLRSVEGVIFARTTKPPQEHA